MGKNPTLAFDPRSLLSDFLDGHMSLADLREALSPHILGASDPFVDELVGILFADGDGSDSPELRCELRILLEH